MLYLCLSKTKRLKIPKPGQKIKVHCFYGLVEQSRGAYLRLQEQKEIVVKTVSWPCHNMINIVSNSSDEYIIINPSKKEAFNPHFVLATDGPQDDSIGIGHNFDDQILNGFEITGYKNNYRLTFVSIKASASKFEIINSEHHIIYYVEDRNHKTYYIVRPDF